jgi:hypothetical protein
MRATGICLWLLACGPKDAGPLATAAPTPAPAPAAVGAARLTLRLDPAELTVDSAAGTATLRPGGGVQQDTYEVYVFDLASLATIGGPPAAPIDVVVELGPPVETRWAPLDPTLPSPDGGFTFVTRAGRVVGAAP